MAMENIKHIPQSTIRMIRRSAANSELRYKDYGRATDLNEYSDREITEMIYGIYRDKKIIGVDGGYFVDLNEVIETVCVLDRVSYYKNPTKGDLKTNRHNSIRNIRTFYVKDYLLVTRSKVNGVTRHSIAKLLCKVGAINQGRKEFAGLYSNRNYYGTLSEFCTRGFPERPLSPH